jgi:hypothetical protein
MPSYAHLNPPRWKESRCIRETMLLYVDDPAARKALRRVGSLIYDWAVETTGLPDPESSTRRELRAAAKELRHIQGYLVSIADEPEASVLNRSDTELAYFAGDLAEDVQALGQAIEDKLKGDRR